MAANEPRTDAARIGGEPAARVNQPWPVDTDGGQSTFLLQVPLTAPRLSAAWQDRLLAIFLTDHGLQIRSYPPEERATLVTSPKPAEAAVAKIRALEPIAIPYVPTSAEEDSDDSSAEQLIRGVPALRSQLEEYTQHPAGNAQWLQSPARLPITAGCSGAV